MAFKDLQHYIAALEQQQELHRIKVEADPVYEITEIADRVVKMQGPALYFERLKGSPYPLAINLFGTRSRTCFALGVEDFDEIGSRISSYLSGSAALSSFTDKLKFLWSLKDLKNIQPAQVKKAPAHEVVEPAGNLKELPVLKCWPEDAGRFITLPLVFTKNPETGHRNAGMYRIQIIDEKRALMHWHAHHDGAQHHRLAVKRGIDLEAAVVLGADPATIYAATAPLPPDIDELLFAGFLRNKPVETVKAKTVDIMVPAHAEFVLEGTVSVSETMPEGPFGDHTGFYSGVDDYPVFTLKAITRKHNPVFPATIVGPPPMEDFYMGKATERIFLPLIRMQLPEVVDINFPAEGVFHNCLLVSIDKQFPGHARKVVSSLWGMGQMMLTKLIVVVDKDVDVQNLSETAWKVFSNIDPERDVFFSRGPLDVLDHASPELLYGSKAGVDATGKYPEEGHRRPWPDAIRMSEDVRQLVSRRWTHYGF